MPIQFDSSASAQARGVTSLSVSLTVANQPNRVLVATAHLRISMTTDQVSRSRFNASSLERVAALSDAGGIIRSEMWVLVQPNPGTFNFMMDFSASMAAVIGVASFYGVDQERPLESIYGATATSSAPSVAAAIESVLPKDHVAVSSVGAQEVFGSTLTATPNAPGTSIFSAKTVGGAASTNVLGAMARQVPVASPVTCAWTLSGSTPWVELVSILTPFDVSTLGRLEVIEREVARIGAYRIPG